MSKDLKLYASRPIPFEVYRYQLVVNQAIQLSIDSEYQTEAQIRAHKNKIFQELISNPRFKFTSRHASLNSKLVHTKGDLSIYQMAVKRSLRHDLEDFSEEKIDNYPKFLVAINNNPAVQKIAIQENRSAFRKSHSVSRVLEDSIENKIKKQNLGFYMEPVFDKQHFWNLLKRFKGKVTQLSFDLVTPNISNVSKNLKLNLKEIYKETNAHKTKLELNSDKNSYLDIKENSKIIKSIVDYSAEGGGNIAMKVAGIAKKFHTSESITTFSIDELLLKSKNWDELDKEFREILI